MAGSQGLKVSKTYMYMFCVMLALTALMTSYFIVMQGAMMTKIRKLSECTDALLYNIQLKQSGYKLPQRVIINPHGSFLYRVEVFNVELSRMRTEVLSKRKEMEWNGDVIPTLCIIHEHHDSFLKQMSKNVITAGVVLEWQEDVSSDILLTEYYSWAASEPLCTWLRTPGLLGHSYGVMYNHTCNIDRDVTLKPRDIEPITLHWKPVAKERFHRPTRPIPACSVSHMFYYLHTFLSRTLPSI